MNDMDMENLSKQLHTTIDIVCSHFTVIHAASLPFEVQNIKTEILTISSLLVSDDL